MLFRIRMCRCDDPSAERARSQLHCGGSINVQRKHLQLNMGFTKEVLKPGNGKHSTQQAPTASDQDAGNCQYYFVVLEENETPNVRVASMFPTLTFLNLCTVGQKPRRGQNVTVHCTGYGKDRDLRSVSSQRNRIRSIPYQ
jgi:hypothetical protein